MEPDRETTGISSPSQVPAGDGASTGNPESQVNAGASAPARLHNRTIPTQRAVEDPEVPPLGQARYPIPAHMVDATAALDAAVAALRRQNEVFEATAPRGSPTPQASVASSGRSSPRMSPGTTTARMVC